MARSKISFGLCWVRWRWNCHTAALLSLHNFKWSSSYQTKPFYHFKTFVLRHATVGPLTPAYARLIRLTEWNAEMMESPSCVSVTWAHILQATRFVCFDSFLFSSKFSGVKKVSTCCMGRKLLSKTTPCFFSPDQNLCDASGKRGKQEAQKSTFNALFYKLRLSLYWQYLLKAISTVFKLLRLCPPKYFCWTASSCAAKQCRSAL